MGNANAKVDKELSAKQRRSAIAAILVRGVRRWKDSQSSKTVSPISDKSLAKPLDRGSATPLSVVDAGSNVGTDASELSIPTTGENHVR